MRCDDHRRGGRWLQPDIAPLRVRPELRELSAIAGARAQAVLAAVRAGISSSRCTARLDAAMPAHVTWPAVGRGYMWLCLVACGRIEFDRIGDGSLGPTGDGRLDDAGPDVMFGNCWSKWIAGPLDLSPPQPATALNSSSQEGDPSLSDDALQIYFARGGDIYVATRPNRQAPFGTPVLLPELSSPADDTKLTLANNGLLAVLSTDRTGSSGYDLWEFARATTADVFQAPSQTPFAQVNTTANQYDPHLSRDGLRVYFAPAMGGTQVVQVAERASPIAPFGTPTDVTNLGLNVAADPSLSPDELVIVHTTVLNSADPPEIWYASRGAIGDVFANARVAPVVNSGLIDQDPVLAYDGCELYFMSARTGNADIYVSVVR